MIVHIRMMMIRNKRKKIIRTRKTRICLSIKKKGHTYYVEWDFDVS
jgi:hypothetical protein